MSSNLSGSFSNALARLSFSRYYREKHSFVVISLFYHDTYVMHNYGPFSIYLSRNDEKGLALGVGVRDDVTDEVRVRKKVSTAALASHLFQNHPTRYEELVSYFILTLQRTTKNSLFRARFKLASSG